MLFEALKQFIRDKYYTYVECITMLNNYYAHAQLTHEQYDELMEMSKELDANNSDDELQAKFTVMDKRFETIENEINNLKEAISSSGTVIPPIDEPDGSEFNPITAYSGLAYKKNLYYLDQTNNEVYKCIDRADIPEDGVQLFNLPHELVNIYFYWVRKEIQ